MSYFSQIFVKKASGTVINPSTEEKQDAAIAKLPTLNSDGSAPVSVKDKTSFVVDLYLHKNIAGTYGINSNTTIDTYTVIMDSTTLPVNGNTVCLKEGVRFYQGAVLSFTGTNPYTLTLDTPLDFAFTTAGSVHLAEHDLSVDGSTTPQVYHITPPSGAVWNITRMILHMEDGVVMDSAKFGGISALTKGLVLRRKDGVFQNIFNVKTNGEISERSYDIEYDPKAPAGVYGFRSRSSFAGQDKRGVAIQLDGSTGDEFQVIVQDDLTALSHFHIVVQGYVIPT